MTAFIHGPLNLSHYFNFNNENKKSCKEIFFEFVTLKNNILV